MQNRVSDSREVGKATGPGRRLDLGCGRVKLPGYIGMDRLPLPGVDVVHDLEILPWPLGDSSFDFVHCSHVLEHLENLVAVMEEVHRILRPGGSLFVRVPYYRSPGAFQDPTHKRFFTEKTFEYFTPDGTSKLSALNYYSKARFRVVSLEFGWRGRWNWHVDHYLKRPRARWLLHRLLAHRKDELRVTMVAVK